MNWYKIAKNIQLSEEILESIEEVIPQIMDKWGSFYYEDSSDGSDPIICSITIESPYSGPKGQRKMIIDIRFTENEWKGAGWFSANYLRWQITDHIGDLYINVLDPEPDEKELRNLLYHEIIHAVDPKWKPETQKQRNEHYQAEEPSDFGVEYYTDKLEIDAHMGELELMMKREIQELLGSRRKKQIIKELNELRNWLIHPSNVVPNLLKDKEKEIGIWLNIPSIKRLLLSRIYNTYSYLVQMAKSFN